MVQIGIVDDDPAGRAIILAHLKQYRAEHGGEFEVRTFTDGAELAENYRPEFDLLFLDVMMNELDGFETAHAIREIDSRVLIVFVTNMAQFAIKGYEVDALSYLIKPVPYFAFSQQLTRSLRRIKKLNAEAETVLLPTANGATRLDVADIVYLESKRHRIFVYGITASYEFTGTLKAMSEQLAGPDFYRSNNCYLVNLRHVRSVNQSACIMTNGAELAISRSRRKGFLEALSNFVGGSS